MKKKTFWSNNLTLAVFILLAAVVAVFNIPYITPILTGFIVAILTYPIFCFFRNRLQKVFPKRKWKTTSSVLTIVICFIVIGLFSNLFVRQLLNEIPSLARETLEVTANLAENETVSSVAFQLGFSEQELDEGVANLNNSVKSALSSLDPEFREETTNFNPQLSEERLDQLLNFGTQAGQFIVDQLIYLVIFILTWLNALVSGESWVESIMDLLPLDEDEQDKILNTIKLGVTNVVYANILSGIIHSLFVFIVMIIFGLPNVFFVTSIVFLIGFLPLSPSELGYVIPVALLFPQNAVAAIIFAILAELLILWTNYVFIPGMITSNEEGNSLLILTSVLTGISIFGPMGFLIAPVIMIFVQTLYQIAKKRHLEMRELAKNA